MMILSKKLDNFGPIWLRNDPFGLKCHIPMFQSPVWGGGPNSGKPAYIILARSLSLNAFESICIFK